MSEVASLSPLKRILAPIERGRDFIADRMVQYTRGGILRTLEVNQGVWHGEEQLISGVRASRLLERLSHDALLGLVHEGVVSESTLGEIGANDLIFQRGTQIPIASAVHEAERGRLIKTFLEYHDTELDMDRLDDRLEDYGGVHEEWEDLAYRAGIMPYADTLLYRRK